MGVFSEFIKNIKKAADQITLLVLLELKNKKVLHKVHTSLWRRIALKDFEFQNLFYLFRRAEHRYWNDSLRRKSHRVPYRYNKEFYIKVKAKIERSLNILY